MQRCITVKNPACYDLDPYIGKYAEYTSIDEPDKPLAYAGHIERDSRGEAMVHDSGESWVYCNVKASAPDFPGLLFLPGFCILDI